MKVIFLDHDGVICLATEWGGRVKKQLKVKRKLSQSVSSLPVDVRFDNFNKKAIEVLNEILEETGAEIVVSSDWKKWADVDEMGEYYESQGIIKKPIAFTKRVSDCTYYNEHTFVWSPRWMLEQERSIEITQYLHDHPEITHWVAIDDLNMGIPQVHESWGDMEMDWGLANFVLTPKRMEGIKQSGIKEKILNYLTENK
jgi:hypothetical protein